MRLTSEQGTFVLSQVAFVVKSPADPLIFSSANRMNRLQYHTFFFFKQDDALTLARAFFMF